MILTMRRRVNPTPLRHRKTPDAIGGTKKLYLRNGDAKIAEACRSRILRSGAKTNFKLGGNAEAINPGAEAWNPNFVVDGEKGRALFWKRKEYP